MNSKNKTRKQLILEYKERSISGGVFRIVNTSNGRYLLLCETDLVGSKNRFDFSVKTGSCVNFKLQSDWQKFSADSFRFEILEELDKKSEQSIREFKADLQTLKELWIEKLDPSLSY